MPIVYRSIAEAAYTQDLADAPQGVGATRTSLRRLLHSLDSVGWSKSEESGRLDRRALTRYAVGSANIFSRRMRVEAETSAVSILIDCSGSMGLINFSDSTGMGAPDSRIDVAQKITVHLSKMLQQARASFAITGFRNGNFKINGTSTTEEPGLLPFKPWGKTLQACVPLIGSIKRCATGSTPDYSALAYAIEDLSHRPEQRKILFVLGDGDGYHVPHMQHLQRLADKLGITIVAIGIQSADVMQCFVNAVVVNDLKDLANAAFNQLLKAVRRKVHA